jgi:hypothetical protein
MELKISWGKQGTSIKILVAYLVKKSYDTISIRQKTPNKKIRNNTKKQSKIFLACFIKFC